MACRCLDIFSPEQAKVLREYRDLNFAKKELDIPQRRRIGKCPLTPYEVSYIAAVTVQCHRALLYIVLHGTAC